MDWYVPNDGEGTRDLRHDFMRFITRHASPDSDLEAAQLIFSELLTNAVESSDGPVWVSLDWGGQQPVLTVNDLGPGFELPGGTDMPDPSMIGGRGLLIVTHLVDHLEVARKAAGGSRVRAILPLRRPSSASIESEPIPLSRLLPAPSEVGESGRFGREPFLMALVVQLAQAAERETGPATAEALVSEVGSGVGFRMEEAFRQYNDLPEDPLSVDQIAELLVGLKHGIDGDFFVIEADEERIVLGNRRCPFGDAVRYAPALCRMTSSVFGGIASRNRDGVAVHLEERIAVGDPECRVTVWLTPPPAEIEPEVHFYRRLPRDG